MSSSRAAVHGARDVDELIAVEWALEDLYAESSRRDRALGGGGGADAEQHAADAVARREDELRREHERELAAARADAYEEGRRAGEIAEAARLRTALLACEQVLQELRAAERKWTDAVEENIAALAVAVARHLLGRELRGDAVVVADLVRKALTEFPIDQALRIRVNPQDLATLSTLKGADGAPVSLTGGREASWHADALVAPGGCVVEGRDRIIDGRVDACLERVYRRLTYTNA